VAELEAERRGEEQDARDGKTHRHTLLAQHKRLLANYTEELRATAETPDQDLMTTRRRLQAAPNSTGKVVHIHLLAGYEKSR
jgi:hypothetical protein